MVFAGVFRDPNVCSRRGAQPRTLVGREAPVGDRAAPQILYRPPGLHHAVVPVTGRAEQQVPQLVRSDVRFGRLLSRLGLVARARALLATLRSLASHGVVTGGGTV